MRVLRHYFSAQFLKFAAVGGLAAGLHWLVRLILSTWIPFYLSVALAYLAGMIIALILNAIYVFPDSNKPFKRQASAFFTINLAFFPIVWGMAIGLLKLMNYWRIDFYNEEVSHALAIPVPVLATFLLYKFVAFADLGSQNDSDLKL